VRACAHVRCARFLLLVAARALERAGEPARLPVVHIATKPVSHAYSRIDHALRVAANGARQKPPARVCPGFRVGVMV
jgi:hypothetical protein